MKKIQSTNLIAMIIGLIAILAGIIAAISSDSFEDYYFSLFIGIALFGTAYLNHREWKKKND